MIPVARDETSSIPMDSQSVVKMASRMIPGIDNTASKIIGSEETSPPASDAMMVTAACAMAGRFCITPCANMAINCRPPCTRNGNA